MPTPKHDYSSDNFYLQVYDCARAGMNDKEIAGELELDSDTFTCMKNGNYIGWTEKENAERSKRLLGVLSRGREKVNYSMKAKMMSLALGKATTSTRSTTRKHVITKEGEVTDDVEVSTTEVETTLPPSLQSITTWLHHHDPDWRKYDNNKDVDEEGMPRSVEAININVAYNKKEDVDLQGKRTEVKDDPEP